MWSSHATPSSRSCSRGHGDELLHLLGGEAERLGLDVDGDRGELRQHVGLRPAQRPDAEHHDHHGDGDDSPTSLEARPDDPTHHWREPPCVWWAVSCGTSTLSACGRGGRSRPVMESKSGSCRPGVWRDEQLRLGALNPSKSAGSRANRAEASGPIRSESRRRSPRRSASTPAGDAVPFSMASGTDGHDSPTTGAQERVSWWSDTSINQGIDGIWARQPRTPPTRGRAVRGTCGHRSDHRDGDKDCSFDRHLPRT